MDTSSRNSRIPSNLKESEEPDTSNSVTLADLPNELLTMILCYSELSTKRSWRNLRLVCLAINNVLKQRSVGYFRLRIPKHPGQVEQMLANPSTFEGWARTLHLEVQDWKPQHEGEWKALASLLRRMRGLKAIRWVNAGPLDKDVVEALGSLPGVNELELLFVKTSPGDTLRFSSSMLAKLRSISLQFRHPIPSLTRRNLVALNSETKNSVSYLVASSPCLEHLCIGPEEIRPLGLVSMMARGDSAQNNPLSLLRSVTAIAIDLPLQPKYIPFLKDLTSLELPNNREKDQQLWSAFRASKFKLKAIKVEIPSSQLIDYLLSYRGLETFHLGGRASDIVESLYGSPGDQSVRLLQSALYEQRMSLRNLRRTESNPSLVTYGTTYVASIELLRPLHRFRHLERLDFVYSIGLRGPLTAALDMLAALSPKLKTACFTILRPEKSYLRRRSRGRNLVGSGLHMEEVLRPLSEGYCFKIRPARWQELRVVFRSLEPDYIQIPAIPLRVYRAVYEVVEEAGQYRLVLDPVATELLNEGGACLRDEDAILT